MGSSAGSAPVSYDGGLNRIPRTNKQGTGTEPKRTCVTKRTPQEKNNNKQNLLICFARRKHQQTDGIRCNSTSTALRETPALPQKGFPDSLVGKQIPLT